MASKKRGNKRLVRILQIMGLTGTLVIANVLFVMIGQMHIWSGEAAINDKIADALQEQIIQGDRGTIYDRNGNIIAEDIKAYTIIAYTPYEYVTDLDELTDKYTDYVKDAKEMAEKLSTILDIDVDTVATYYQNAYDNGWAETELGEGTKHLNEDQKNAIDALEISGIHFIDSVNRYYPVTPFASSLIGYTEVENVKDEDGSTTEVIVGQNGLEAKLNDELTGENGVVRYLQKRNGNLIPGTTSVLKQATNGNDVTLTLDSTLQQTVEQSMQETMENNNATKAWCIVMECETGKILAWAEYPTFDQNVHKDIPNSLTMMTQDLVEVGSVMKPFTYAVAIDTGVYPTNKKYRAYQFWYQVDADGNIIRVDEDSEVQNPPISDALGEDFGTITFDEGLAYSSNVGICELLANYINFKDYKKYLDAFGFFKKVGMKYVDEQVGTENIDTATDYLSTGFGQSSSMTILSLCQAYTSIFNDGIMMKPYVVEKITDENGKVVEDNEPEVVGTPISSETASQVRELMKNVVNMEGASGERFKIDGIDMIAKTGTGEIYDTELGSYRSDIYTSSIMAAAPADDPKIMVYWGMQSTNYIYYSAAQFQEVMIQALNINAVDASVDEEETEEVTDENSEENAEETVEEVVQEPDYKTYTMPNLINHSMTYVNDKLENMDTNKVIIGNGNTVVDQYPLEDTKVNSKDTVFVLTNGSKITMPDMSGWTKKDITAFWKLTGISIETDGSGEVVYQNIEAGTEINTSTEISVELN